MAQQDTDGTRTRRPWVRLAWFVAIWAASVAALGLVAYGIRLMIL